MKNSALTFVVVSLIAGRVQAQNPAIEHQPAACAVAEKFPQMKARFSPAESLANARVVFQGQSTDWYSVAMKKEGADFVGVLPKPMKSLKSFRYYVEATDRSLATNRTPEYTTAVVDSSGACKGGLLAGALGSASVVLQGPAGVLPVGFSPAGIIAGSAAGSSAGAAGASAAGGGGLSGGAIAGIVGGVGAAAAGAVIVKSKAESVGSSRTTYSGPVSGQITVTQIAVSGFTQTCSFLRSLNGTMSITQTQGSASPGEALLDLTEAAISVSPPCSGTGPACCGPSTFTCTLTGTSSSMACGAERTSTASGQTNAQSFNFSGSLSGGVVSGTVTFTRSGGGTTNITTTTHSGSASIPVTLR